MIQKPLLDSREYRHISLPNKLEALLISDPSADKAAAAMDVHVGSLFDPPAYQGLAHFLEHMLFLGTSKYPAEDEYQSFLAKHGGMSNAFTADNHTCYFFNVAPDHLEGALDRFGQFFVSPLFTQAATDREVNAVHSEHSKNVQDDMWRQYQLMRTVCFDERHPTHHFSTGNKDTLGSVPREVLLNFHKAWYSANVSRMSVLGRESLDELQTLVEGIFSQVVNKDVVVPVGFGFGKPWFIASLSSAVESGNLEKNMKETSEDSFSPDTDVPVVNKAFLNQQLFIVPVKEQRSVQFCWFLPEQQNLWRSKPSKYLSHIFGHEGRGSLTSVLKEKGIATDLVGGLFYDCAGTALFKIDIHLTKPAASNLNLGEIAEIVAAYIRLARSEFSELLWKEVETVDNLSFAFRATVDPMNAVQSAANALHYYPVEEVLAGGTKIYEFDEAAIRDHLGELVPEKLFITTIGKEFEPMCDSTEEYYGTKYGVKEIDSKLILDRMKRVEEMSMEEFKSICSRLEMSMPNPNPFLPENLNVLPPHGSSVAVPTVVFQNGSSSAFFKQDETFEMPKGNVALAIYSPFVSRSLSNYAASDLWLQSLNEEHSQVAYQAEIAGLKYKLKATLEGVSFSVQGYSDKMKDIILSVFGNIKSFEPNEHLFALVKDRTVKTLQSQLLQKAPYSQGLDLINQLIMSPFYSTSEKLDQVHNTCLKDLKILSRQNSIFESAIVEALIEGNFHKSDAFEISHSVVNEIIRTNTPSTDNLVGTVKVMHLESDIELKRRGVNPQETNGAVVVSVQTGWVTSHVAESNNEDLLTAALLSLTSQICGQKFFDDLRTKQQLGYIVHSAGTVQERRAGLLFLVQSEVPTREVRQKIFDFINNLEATIQSIPEEDFARYIEAVVTEYKEKPKNQGEEFQRHWAEIEKRRFDFTRKERLIPVVQTITKTQLVEYVRKNVIQAPKVIATVTGSGEPEAQESFSNEEIKHLRNSATWINSNNRPLSMSKL